LGNDIGKLSEDFKFLQEIAEFVQLVFCDGNYKDVGKEKKIEKDICGSFEEF
jgi:hypothetical protein